MLLCRHQFFDSETNTKHGTDHTTASTRHREWRMRGMRYSGVL